MKSPSHCGVRDVILNLCKQPGGIGLHEVPGYTTRQVSDSAGKLAKDGTIFKAGIRHEARYFADQQECEAYAASLEVKHRERLKRKWRTQRAKTREKRRETKRLLVLEHASMPGGVGIDGVPGVTRAQLRDTARHLREEGLLFAVGKREMRRYFTDINAAAEYERDLPAKKAKAKKERRLVRDRALRAKKKAEKVQPKAAKQPKTPKPAKEAGVSIKNYGRAPWSKDTPAIVPDHVQVVVCPSPPEFGLAAKLKRAA